MTPQNDVTCAEGSFDYSPRTRILYGEGVSRSAGELARELLGTRILLVTDAGIARAGHAEVVLRNIERAGLAVTLYDRVRENPTTRDI